VAPQRVPLLLTTPGQRAAIMLQEGIEQVLILPFTREISLLEPVEFAGRVLSQALDARAVLVGDNFRFGHRHAGDTQLLGALGDRFGFVVEAIPALRLRGRVVSSSEIRRLVAAGNVSLAGRLLEAPFALQGEVVSGQGIGSRQTVPTLNLAAQSGVLPALGVYITRTRDLAGQRVWPSVSNVGYRPTFDGDALTVETFLIEALDGPTPPSIRVEFLRRLRPERKFPSADALKTQILRDVARARSYFRRTDRSA
jgi:riboflavin kinase/FMN adenylyltransferase